MIYRVKVDGNAISSGFGAVKEKVTGIFNSVKEKVTSTFDSIWNKVKGVADKLKNIFNFKWELPKLKLPKFSITGQFSLNPPQVPHLSVQWLKKAMDNGMIFDSPTIFGASGGSLLGAGDAGPEAVVGVGSLMGMISRAVSDMAGPMNAGAAGPDPAAAQMLNLLSQYLPQLANMSVVTDTGVMVGQLAPQMNRTLGEMMRRERRQ